MSQRNELIIPTNIATLKVVEPVSDSITIEMNPELELATGEKIEFMYAKVAYISGVPEDEERQIYESNDAHLTANIDPTQVVHGVAQKYKLPIEQRTGIFPFRTKDGKITGELRPTPFALVAYNVTEMTEDEKNALFQSESEDQIPTINALVPSSETLELSTQNQNEEQKVVKVVNIAAFNFKRKNKLAA